MDKSYFQDLLANVRELVGDSKAIVFLESGHFDPRHGAVEFSKETLKDSLVIIRSLVKEYGKRVKIVLGVLVDDLGLECGESVCEIVPGAARVGSTEQLPQELEELFKSPYVKRDRLLVSSERTCKNRGLLTLKKLIRSDKCETKVTLTSTPGAETKVFFEDNESNQILLSEFSGSVWKAKCPTIMGQHYVDCFMKMMERDREIQKLIIIDWSERLDLPKVTAGSQAAFKVFAPESLNSLSLNILNIFFGDDVGSFCEIVPYSNQQAAGVTYV